MYNIVVFSSGRGSIAIQEGFSAIYGEDSYNLDVIIHNDNSKSSGICRKIFDGENPVSESLYKKCIEKADLIIFNFGRQWPGDFSACIQDSLQKMLTESKVKKYVVINGAKGITAVKINDLSDPGILLEDNRAVCGEKAEQILTKTLMMDFFDIAGFKGTYIYDLDGTLWDGRADKNGKAVGAENMNLFCGIVHSGNSYEHVRDVFRDFYHQKTPVDIYSDFGNVHFTSNDYTKDILSAKYTVEDGLIEALEKVPAFKGKIKVRGEGCVVTIKPLADREVLLSKAQEALSVFDNRYLARITGHTSIDVMDKDYDKKTMLQEIMKKHGLKPENVIFIGNETEAGTEANIKEAGVRTLQVDDIYECNVLLKTIQYM